MTRTLRPRVVAPSSLPPLFPFRAQRGRMEAARFSLLFSRVSLAIPPPLFPSPLNVITVKRLRKKTPRSFSSSSPPPACVPPFSGRRRSKGEGKPELVVFPLSRGDLILFPSPPFSPVGNGRNLTAGSDVRIGRLFEAFFPPLFVVCFFFLLFFLCGRFRHH